MIVPVRAIIGKLSNAFMTLLPIERMTGCHDYGDDLSQVLRLYDGRISPGSITSHTWPSYFESDVAFDYGITLYAAQLSDVLQQARDRNEH